MAICRSGLDDAPCFRRTRVRGPLHRDNLQVGRFTLCKCKLSGHPVARRASYRTLRFLVLLFYCASHLAQPTDIEQYRRHP